ncbi:Uncharacterised protein [Vibrio cholerae]|nr:Uncharacterised protein [Vibrio cholerae]
MRSNHLTLWVHEHAQSKDNQTDKERWCQQFTNQINQFALRP